MKVAVLGANWSPSAEPMDQTVVPATGLPSPSVQVKAVPPHSWTSIPRCRLYQACSAGASLALKKMPPIPVTRFIEPPGLSAGHPPRFRAVALGGCGVAGRVFECRQSLQKRRALRSRRQRPSQDGADLGKVPRFLGQI